MSEIDAYLARVARGMAGMDRALREDVLKELRSHLADAAREQGEAAALASAEPPEALAARYRALYGYGRPLQMLFVALAAILAIPTLPLLLYAGLGWLEFGGVALAFLVLLVVYLMAVAVKAGSTAGLWAGVAACVSRIVSLAVLQAIAGAVAPEPGGWPLTILVSVLLVAIGYLPGRAKERWQRREVTL